MANDQRGGGALPGWLSERALVGFALLVVAFGASACHRTESDSVTAVRGALVAGPHVLSGTVFGGGTAMPGTLVEALTDGTTTVVASSTTDASGGYSLSLSDATYDLRVTPPTGSGFGVQAVQNVVMSGADRRDDVVLIAKGGVVTGHVRGYGAAGLAGVQVDARDNATGTTIASGTTDATGLYQMNLGAGTYYFVVSPSFPYPAGAPNQGWYEVAYNQVISGSTTLDFDLPVARVQGVVTDSAGAPVPGASVSAVGYDNTGSLAKYFNGVVQTDADGRYECLVFTGPANTFVVTPPSPLGTLVQSGVAVSGDMTRDFALSDAILVSGHVRGYGAAGLAGVQVDARDNATGTTIASGTTDATGLYQMNLGAGTYYFVVSPSFPYPAGAPNQGWYEVAYNQVISGSTTLDFDLPVARVQGVVTDSAGAPVPGASVSAVGYDNTGSLAKYFNGVVQTDADGRYECLVFTGPANTFTVTPPSPLGTLVQSGVAVNGDMTRDFVLSQATLVSGHVRGYGAGGLLGVQVDARDNTTGTTIASGTTDAAGLYQLNLGAGTYYFVVSPSFPYPAGAPNQGWYKVAYNQVISGSTTLDFDLPVAKVQGAVTDSNGAPVPGVSVSAVGYNNTGSVATYFNSTVQTDADGHYQLLVFTGPADTFTVTPPSASGFSTTDLANVGVTGDFTQTIILESPDLSPPIVVSGPSVVHLSDTSVSIHWQTNEPADSLVDYGVGGLTTPISNTTLVTTHEVTLVGLLPSTIYEYRVSSRDASGNGPTTSAVLTFQTEDPPGDIMPPVITAGPTVSGIGQDTAIVVWTTDEPASTVVHTGTSAALGTNVDVPGQFTPNHQMTLTGLSPSTKYFFQVESTDPDGNGPTLSATATFTTAAVPDTTPPKIISGPDIKSATDTTLTVVWTTDEPASSGVSYNDGTTFFVVNDDKLVTAHEVVLAGLTPGTTYHITVSSTDLVGNGPTLAGPISGTTTTVANSPPVVTVPANMIVEATLASGAVVSFVASANDPEDGPLTPVCTPASGSTFSLGKTTVTCQATDSHAATASGSFTVTVRDTTAPVLTVPADITVDADANGTAGVTYAASATDVVSGAVSPTCTPASETRFPIGGTTVNCTATDAAGNHATKTFTVTVRRPNTPPTVTVSGGLVVEATGPGGAVVIFQASATDLEDGPLTPTCAPASGTRFPLGTTPVTCKATDSAGAIGSATFTVKVVDTTPPALVVPATITVNGDSTGTAVVTFTATASDIVSGTIVPTCTPASGSRFPAGTMAVSCAAQDAAGNRSTGGFTVTVRNANRPPVVTVPANITTEATGPTGAKVSFQATATDPEQGALTPVCAPASGKTFPIGTTTVTCKATDNAGASASASFTITVQDTTPPVFTCAATYTTVYAAYTTGATVAYVPPAATDVVSGAATVKCTPAPKAIFPIGNSPVTCTAKDTAGNIATTTFTVRVIYQAPTDGTFFLSPIKSDGSAKFKKTTVVSVKFKLTGASAGITNLQARLLVALVQNGVPGTYQAAPGTGATGGGNTFAYSSSGKQYTFSLDTNTLATGTWSLKADLGDGVSHIVNIGITP